MRRIHGHLGLVATILLVGGCRGDFDSDGGSETTATDTTSTSSAGDGSGGDGSGTGGDTGGSGTVPTSGTATTGGTTSGTGTTGGTGGTTATTGGTGGTTGTTGGTGSTGDTSGGTSTGGTTTGTSDTGTTSTGGSGLLPDGAILIFAGACPAGWNEVFTMQNKFPRGHDGDGTYGEEGGSASHTHQISGHTHATGSDGTAHDHNVSFAGPNSTGMADAGANPAASNSHSHPDVTSSQGGGPHTHDIGDEPTFDCQLASNTPPFREGVFCQLDLNQADGTVPTSSMMLYDGQCPPGFSEESAFRNRFLAGHDGDNDFAEEGGTDTHDHGFVHDHGGDTAAGGGHTHTAVTSAPTTTFSHGGTAGSTVSSSTHTHEVDLPSFEHAHTISAPQLVTDSVTVLPEHREATFCEADAPVPPVADMMILFDEACPVGWSEEASFRGRLIRGHDNDGSPAETGGTPVHGHDGAHDHEGSTGATAHTHNGLANASDDTTGANSGSGGWVARYQHTHSGSPSSEDFHGHSITATDATVVSVDHTPPFREVVVCKMD